MFTNIQKVTSALPRLILPTLFVGVLSAGTLFPAHGATLEEIKKRGYINLVTEDDFRPFEFIQNGKPTGFDNELIDKLRANKSLEVRQQIIPFTGLLAGLVSGKYDVAATALLITKERQKVLDFTKPIAEATVYYVKRKGDRRINSVADLKGLTIGLQAGGATYQRLPELEKTLAATGGKIGKVVQYTSYPEAYQDLALGRTDYVINNLIGLQVLIKEKGDVFELGQAVSSKTYIAWGVTKGNQSLITYLNSFIEEQSKNGVIPALQKKWFGTVFTDMPDHFISEY